MLKRSFQRRTATARERNRCMDCRFKPGNDEREWHRSPRREAQRITSVLMRLGTSPTGMTARNFIVCVSTAETERSPALEM